MNKMSLDKWYKKLVYYVGWIGVLQLLFWFFFLVMYYIDPNKGKRKIYEKIKGRRTRVLYKYWEYVVYVYGIIAMVAIIMIAIAMSIKKAFFL